MGLLMFSMQEGGNILRFLPSFWIVKSNTHYFSYILSLFFIYLFSLLPQVGIVGRTGAGKSSLITSLFRLTEPNGDIRIDSLSVKELGLHNLRGRLSIIPQDPVIFSGTVRMNLDPYNQASDDKLWNALEEVWLVELNITLRINIGDGIGLGTGTSTGFCHVGLKLF